MTRTGPGRRRLIARRVEGFTSGQNTARLKVTPALRSEAVRQEAACDGCHSGVRLHGRTNALKGNETTDTQSVAAVFHVGAA